MQFVSFSSVFSFAIGFSTSFLALNKKLTKYFLQFLCLECISFLAGVFLKVSRYIYCLLLDCNHFLLTISMWKCATQQNNLLFGETVRIFFLYYSFHSIITIYIVFRKWMSLSIVLKTLPCIVITLVNHNFLQTFFVI